MARRAFEKIAEGLREAIDIARGETPPERLHAIAKAPDDGARGRKPGRKKTRST
ncbi:hypothetical protein [Salinarimonas ramus]|uniref:Uncharacterized protein n=1 Tax=Salinarimonas ramus TaxID=690164 RepID=A0A917Q5N1_9HYPH|nr:hypothetical protein [Salinarimonas ramus]GGK25442.1 hypothetical protein GCM10011322_10000 [Salinarimonas ramus]